jgi:hypothetical protein
MAMDSIHNLMEVRVGAQLLVQSLHTHSFQVADLRLGLLVATLLLPVRTRVVEILQASRLILLELVRLVIAHVLQATIDVVWSTLYTNVTFSAYRYHSSTTSKVA